MRRAVLVVIAALAAIAAVPVAAAVPARTASPVKVHVSPGTRGPRPMIAIRPHPIAHFTFTVKRRS